MKEVEGLCYLKEIKLYLCIKVQMNVLFTGFVILCIEIHLTRTFILLARSKLSNKSF